MTLKQFFIALFAGAVLIQVGLTTCAKAEPPYEVTLENEFGQRLPTYAHRGEWFALGREGQRYNVRVTNRTSQRVEAVVTVDGRDVLTGQPGDFKNQRGYLINAHDSVLIEGFRTSLEHVAAFRFTTPDDSYSARMGTPENVGVIGVALFPEATPPRVVRRPMIPREAEAPRGQAPAEGTGGGGRAEAKRSRGAAPMPSAPAAESYADESASNIGTEYGEQRYSAVNEVPFRRARPQQPERVLLVRYDDREGLIARGILPRPAPRPYRGPSAFPVNRFAPPPPPRSYWN
jgi:hypothetical protein